jgi:hypothetical protein
MPNTIPSSIETNTKQAATMRSQPIVAESAPTNTANRLGILDLDMLPYTLVFRRRRSVAFNCAYSPIDKLSGLWAEVKRTYVP